MPKYGVAAALFYMSQDAYIALFGFSIFLVLGFFVLKIGWDNKILKPLMYLPFGAIISAIGFLGLNVIGV